MVPFRVVYIIIVVSTMTGSDECVWTRVVKLNRRRRG